MHLNRNYFSNIKLKFLLALDTSGDTCSVALWKENEIFQIIETIPRRHGESILPMLDKLLKQSNIKLENLQAIAVSCGPGSFTGVRIAVAVAQGLAFGAGLPLIPISTLAAQAQGQFRREGQTKLLVALDARLGEIYWGAFIINDHQLAVLEGEEQVSAPNQVIMPVGTNWFGVGSGWEIYREKLANHVGDAVMGSNPIVYCEARDVAVLGVAAAEQTEAYLAPEQLTPRYLRDKQHLYYSR